MEIGAHYGYVKELAETLIQMSKSPGKFNKKFPLVWLMEPFTIASASPHYGKIDELRMYIMTDTKREYKSYQRKEITFKPVLYPIKNELMKQLMNRPEFSAYSSDFSFSFTDYYYWGEDDKSVLNDIVDTIEVRFRNLIIKNNKNCITN
jgi:hypothetical protein